MSRLKLEDGTMDVIVKMAEGNPGAVVSIMNILQKNDWHGEVPGVLVLMHLDDIGIYGSHLYVLVNDCCNNDLNELDKVMRNYQFGIISKEFIQEKAMSGRGTPFTDLHSIEELVNGWYLLGESEKIPLDESLTITVPQRKESAKILEESFIIGVDYSTGSDYTGITKIDADGKTDTTLTRDEKPTDN